ncbi:complex I subunit 5 family protein [Liberiplasma polymorphum]|uniref:complex I subunit 5 family protein n=1 Tax=Liberiplasma polymorphum TaxID=3374570 RepID=UPI003773DA52
MHFTPIYLILIPILSSLIIYLVKNKFVNYIALISQTLLTILAILYYTTYQVPGGIDAPLVQIGGWATRVGISLRVDSLSMSFIFLTLFSWWMVLIYIFDRKKHDYNLLFFLIFLQGVFLGIVQTNDLFNMFVFVELTTIIVTILIAYNKTGASFRAAIYYLLLNTSGVLAFLIGIILVYNVFGTINIQIITENMELYKDYTVIKYAFALMLAGVSVKAALFPVFTWLPKAHGTAKSSISALLSGLIVKGGLYLFIRINQMFAAAEFNYQDFFFVIGAVTALLGIIFAISQKDLKQMLAYSTISQVGLIMVGLSSQDPQVFYGGVYHIFNHALFKILLFLSVGVIIKVFSSKKIDEIRGMFRTMPLISIAMIIGMLAITGAPLLNGFISKSIIIYGFRGTNIKYWTLFIANIGTATLFMKMAVIFFGKKQVSYRMHHWSYDIVLSTLALACILLGNLYIPIARGFFGVDLSAIRAFSLGALFDYALVLLIAFLLNYFFIKKDYAPLKALRNFQLSFEHANYIFIGYIALLTAYFVLI